MTSSPGLVFALGEASQTSSRGSHSIPALGVSYPQRGCALSPERDPCLGCEQPHQAEAGRAST